MGPAKPVIEQVSGGIACAEVEVVPPLLHHCPEILGDGDAAGPAAFALGGALSGIGADAVLVGFFPRRKQRLKGFGSDGQWFGHG